MFGDDFWRLVERLIIFLTVFAVIGIASIGYFIYQYFAV